MRAIFDEFDFRPDIRNAHGLGEFLAAIVWAGIGLCWLPFAAPLACLVCALSALLCFVTSQAAVPFLSSLGFLKEGVSRIVWLVCCVAFGLGTAQIALQSTVQRPVGRKILAWLNTLLALPLGAVLVYVLFPPKNGVLDVAHVVCMGFGSVWLFRLQYSYRVANGYTDSWW